MFTRFLKIAAVWCLLASTALHAQSAKPVAEPALAKLYGRWNDVSKGTTCSAAPADADEVGGPSIEIRPKEGRIEVVGVEYGGAFTPKIVKNDVQLVLTVTGVEGGEGSTYTSRGIWTVSGLGEKQPVLIMMTWTLTEQPDGGKRKVFSNPVPSATAYFRCGD